jgi:hypothetical protein
MSLEVHLDEGFVTVSWELNGTYSKETKDSQRRVKDDSLKV